MVRIPDYLEFLLYGANYFVSSHNFRARIFAEVEMEELKTRYVSSEIAEFFVTLGDPDLYSKALKFLDQVAGIEDFILEENLTPETELSTKLANLPKNGPPFTNVQLAEVLSSLHCFYYKARLEKSRKFWNFYEDSLTAYKETSDSRLLVCEVYDPVIDFSQMEKWVRCCTNAPQSIHPPALS